MNICPNCHIGQLHVRRVPYLLPFGSHIVTVPALRAWLCDACGELTYDEEALVQLDMLLGVDAELEPERHPRSRPAAAEPRPGPSAVRRRLA